MDLNEGRIVSYLPLSHIGMYKYTFVYVYFHIPEYTSTCMYAYVYICIHP
jgi:hypothetical protein